MQLQYGEPVIRRSVPLGLALLSASNPKLQVIDILSKFSHDHDSEVAHNAIFAMGIVGAGKNPACFSLTLLFFIYFIIGLLDFFFLFIGRYCDRLIQNIVYILDFNLDL